VGDPVGDDDVMDGVREAGADPADEVPGIGFEPSARRRIVSWRASPSTVSFAMKRMRSGCSLIGFLSAGFAVREPLPSESPVITR